MVNIYPESITIFSEEIYRFSCILHSILYSFIKLTYRSFSQSIVNRGSNITPLCKILTKGNNSFICLVTCYKSAPMNPDNKRSFILTIPLWLINIKFKLYSFTYIIYTFSINDIFLNRNLTKNFIIIASFFFILRDFIILRNT